MSIQIGCQTYTWQMSGGVYDGRLDHIIKITAEAGYAGVESETRFLGKLADPKLLGEHLSAAKVAMPALTLVEDWLLPEETDEERARADECLQILTHFPDTMLNICQMPGSDRENLVERQKNCLLNANAIAKRAADLGIRSGYHPNSPPGSVFRTAEDYEILLNGLDQSVLGYIPDSGHIAAGGMDPFEIVKKYFSQVVHVHFKDMNAAGEWEPMGGGILDHVGITKHLAANNYDGWIVVEDECHAAIGDPDTVTKGDGAYCNSVLLPLVTSSS